MDKMNWATAFAIIGVSWSISIPIICYWMYRQEEVRKPEPKDPA